MATFRRSQIGELIGSTGSLTFSKNKSGGIVKFKSTNKNRNTVKQAQNRNSFSQANGAWHTLTDEEKNGWNQKGKLNNNSGMNEFLSSYKTSLDINSSLYVSTENIYRINGSSATLTSSYRNFSLKTPSLLPPTNDFNRGRFILNDFKFEILGTSFRNRLLLYFTKISGFPDYITYPNFFQSSNSAFLFLSIKYKLVGSQKATNINSTSWSTLLSLSPGVRISNSPMIVDYLLYRFDDAGFLSLLNKKGVLNKDLFLRLDLVDTFGNSRTIGYSDFKFF